MQSGFSLRCLQSLSGIKFFCTAAPGTQGIPGFLRAVHELYADWVLKDPFYELDMPIRVEKFEQKLLALIADKYGQRAVPSSSPVVAPLAQS